VALLSGTRMREADRVTEYPVFTMRSTLAYTTARILLFAISLILLYLAGAHGLLLIGLALVSACNTFGLGRWWTQTALVRRFPWFT